MLGAGFVLLICNFTGRERDDQKPTDASDDYQNAPYQLIETTYKVTFSALPRTGCMSQYLSLNMQRHIQGLRKTTSLNSLFPLPLC